MGTQPGAQIRLSLAVNATNYEDTIQYTSTVGSYSTDVNMIASSVWAYLYNVQGPGAGNLATPNTTIKWIRGLVSIQNVTAARTPYGMSTVENGPGVNAGAPLASPMENNRFNWNFHLGPFDFQDQPSLAAALSAQIAQAVAFTPNY